MTKPFRIATASAAAAIAVAALAPSALDAARQVRLKAATMIIEFNASAADVGIQFFLNGKG